MKCIRCQHDCKYKERANKVCPGCQGLFAFEPREGDPLSDRAFQHAIELVSSQGQLRFGVENLYYEACRKVRASRPGRIALIVVTLLAAFACATIAGFSGNPLFLLGIFAALGAALGAFFFYLQAKYVRLGKDDFNRLWERWCAAHGTPAGVIIRQPPPPPPNLEADVGDYSFDRAVICDRARSVDLLLANNFHFENNCAILSIEGYPPSVFETVRTMLKRNPRLQVFALHDATVKGCRLAHVLATDPAWFAGQVKVIDVGLRPGHAGPFHGLLLEGRGTPGLTVAEDGITPEEANWLTAHTLELAVIRPEQVLKRLFQAINRQFTPTEMVGAASAGGNGGGDGVIIMDNTSFAADAGDADGGGDSFG